MKSSKRKFGTIGVFLLIVVLMVLLLIRPETNKILEIAGLVMGIAALVFAAKQFLDAGDELNSLQNVGKNLSTQLESLQKVSKILSDLKQQLSTRFVASFPNDLRHIRKFVSEEDVGHLDIMADFAGYGNFSNNSEFRKYLFYLQRRADKSKVRMLIYGDRLAMMALQEQWPDRAAIEARRELLEEFYAKNQQLIRQVCKRSFANFEDFNTNTTYKDLMELRLQAQREIQKVLSQSQNIEIRHIEGDKTVLVVHAWIAKPDRAFFAFNPEAHLNSLCFKTEDERLVKVLSGVFEHLWHAAGQAQSNKASAMASS